ncbi:MAG: NYN domain-containing protein [Actinomycetota bacterium]
MAANGDSDVDREADRDRDHDGLEHVDLRSAIDYALLIASEGRRRRPPLDFPDELRPFLDGQHVSRRALGKLRRSINDDRVFRERLSAGVTHDATADLVDDIGTLWLARPVGWRASIDESLARRAADAERVTDLQAAKREEKRRRAAEQARARAEAQTAELGERVERLRQEVDDLRTDLAKSLEESAEQRVELRDARLELRHARDRERAALDRLAIAERDRDAAEQSSRATARVRDDLLADRADAVASLAEVVAAADAAQSLADQLRSLVPASEPPAERPDRRTPMSLPGGVISTSAEAAECFVRSDAAVLVDGYNVSKLTWPSRTLEQQRVALLDAVENLARRFGTDVTVVFDGADVVGAHAARRRLVRVVYSPVGVTADDVIRDEVRRLPSGRNVVVVTNDQEIVRDIRAWGANPLPSNAFVALL